MIKLFFLVNGDFIIAEMLPDRGPNVYNIRKPLRINVNPQQNGTVNVGFAQWLPFIPPFTKDTEFTLNKEHVLVVSAPTEDFVTQYKAQHSGIVMPKSGGLLPPL
jgi:hypothetical protein